MPTNLFRLAKSPVQILQKIKEDNISRSVEYVLDIYVFLDRYGYPPIFVRTNMILKTDISISVQPKSQLSAFSNERIYLKRGSISTPRTQHENDRSQCGALFLFTIKHTKWLRLGKEGGTL